MDCNELGYTKEVWLTMGTVIHTVTALCCGRQHQLPQSAGGSFMILVHATSNLCSNTVRSVNSYYWMQQATCTASAGIALKYRGRVHTTRCNKQCVPPRYGGSVHTDADKK